MGSLKRIDEFEQRLSSKTKDWWCLFAILLTLVARFWKTIVLAKPISFLFLNSVWDSLFYKLRAGQSLSIDPSLIELHLPYRFFVAEYWHHAIPLWNEFSGFGMPLLADPQAFVLSPLLFFFNLLPSVYVWNITLIMELAVGAICTYFLCRELDLDYLASLSGALLFSFCPWFQWQLELLGNGICLTPFVFLFFVKAAKSKSLWAACVAGIAAAMNILAAHPENSFATIGFASLFLCLVAYNHDRSNFTITFILSRICIAGIIAFGLSSPMLIPFAEYLGNAETYKFTGPAPADISLEALFANYLYPFFTVSSPYFGPLSWLGVIALASFPGRGNRYTKSVLCCFALSILAVTKLFPLSILFGIPPFSIVQSMYFLPEYLLLLSIVSAFGLNKLLFDTTLVPRKNRFAALTLVLIILLFPIIFSPWHHNDPSLRFDPTLAISAFHWKVWLFNTCIAISMTLIWCRMSRDVRNSRPWGRIGLTVLGILNLVVISSKSLPVRPSFQYPNSLPLSIITENGARFISLGDHLFRPNTNVIYGLPSVRAQNPLFPKYFGSFMKACGAEVDEFNQHFPATISRMLDLTGTRTILSEQPLFDEKILSLPSKLTKTGQLVGKEISYEGLLRVNNIELFHDQRQQAIFCRLVATRSFPRRSDFYHLFCEIDDEKGAPVSFIEPQPISGLNETQVITFSAFVPKKLKQWTLSLKLVSDQNSLPIRPALKGTHFKVNRADGACLLATADKPGLFAEISNDRFSPFAHYGGSIVAYENKTALKRYFFVNRTEWVKKKEDALLYLKSHRNEIVNVAVLDDSQKNQFEKLVHKLGVSENLGGAITFNQSGHIQKLDSAGRHYLTTSSTLDLQVKCQKASLLVVSDLYYPGWHVLLDGHDWQMFRADCLYRAVPIPSGTHRVRFEYRPISFAVGLLLFSLSVMGLIIVRLKKHTLIAR